jgi:Reeler domain
MSELILFVLKLSGFVHIWGRSWFYRFKLPIHVPQWCGTCIGNLSVSHEDLTAYFSLLLQHIDTSSTRFVPICPHVVTDVTRRPKPFVEVLWTAPSSGAGCVEFRLVTTSMQSYSLKIFLCLHVCDVWGRFSLPANRLFEQLCYLRFFFFIIPFAIEFIDQHYSISNIGKLARTLIYI